MPTVPRCRRSIYLYSFIGIRSKSNYRYLVLASVQIWALTCAEKMSLCTQTAHQRPQGPPGTKKHRVDMNESVEELQSYPPMKWTHGRLILRQLVWSSEGSEFDKPSFWQSSQWGRSFFFLKVSKKKRNPTSPFPPLNGLTHRFTWHPPPFHVCVCVCTSVCCLCLI